MMDMARRRHLEDIETVLRRVRRALPLGAGESPSVARGLDHLDPDLKIGSAEYVAAAEAMAGGGLL